MKNRFLAIMMAVMLALCGIADGAFLSEVNAESSGSRTATADEILQAVGQDHPAVATDEDSWTIAIYMCGSDLERDGSYGTRDLLEMLGANIPDNVNLIVLTGGAGRAWRYDPDTCVKHDGYVKPEGTQIWQIAKDTQTGKNKMNLLYQYDEYQDMSDVALAKNFFEFAAAYAPAEHMMVDYWDHGGGPIKGSEFALKEDGSDIRYMPLNDLAGAVQALKEVRESQNKKIDIIGFDCCLMASAEIAYAFSGSAGYMIASEETEPVDGWDYYWLNVFGEINAVNSDEDNNNDMDGKAQAEAIGKRVVDLYPADKLVDKTTHDSLDDVGKGIEMWKDRNKFFSKGTMALIDLSCTGKVIAALNDFGAALYSIYDKKDINEDNYLALSKAIKEVPYLSDGLLGQVDIYLLAKSLSDKNITPELTAAADQLIAAVGDGSAPAPEEVEYKEFDKVAGEEIIHRDPGGQIGEPGEGGAVLYRGVTYPYNNCVGLAVFFPANLEVESVYLDAVTGKNRSAEKYKGIYNGRYKELAFYKSAATWFVVYVNEIAKIQDKNRDFGEQSGYIEAVVDNATNDIYMKINKGDASRLTTVLAEVSFENLDGAYYLGNREAKFNEEKGRYEVSDQHRWLCIDNVPVVFEYNDSGFNKIPAVIEKEGDNGRFAPGKYKTGDVVDEADICYLSINPEMGNDDEAIVYSWFDPYLNQNHELSGKKARAGLKFRPLRQELVWDNEKQAYTKGNFIANALKTTTVKDTDEGLAVDPEWDNAEAYIENAVMKKPSDESDYLIIYNFKAYDMNTQAYISNSVYAVETDWSRLSINPIKTQKCTGKAVCPELTFTYNDFPGITLKDLKEGSPGVDIKVSYSDNVRAGTGKVTVTGTDKRTKDVLYKLTRNFKIVKAANVLKVKNKAFKIKYKKLINKDQFIKASKVKKGNSAKTKIRYKLVKVKKLKAKNKNKKAFKVSSKGRIKVKKGTEKGTYKLTIKAKAKATGVYKSAVKKFTVTVKIR